MLAKESWWPQAEGLAPGQKKRVAHDCGEGRTLIVHRDEKGFHAWCFRCNDNGWEPPAAESLADKLARLRRLSAEDESAGRCTAGALPVPSVHEVSQWPVQAATWLYRAGLGRYEIAQHGIYYHPPTDRVVIPVRDGDGNPVFWQARAYQSGRMPKYLGPTPRPPSLVAVMGGGWPCSVITEDLLSATKVGGIAVLGTLANDALVTNLMRAGKPVAVWFDPDPAGQRGASKIIKQLRAYGLTVRNIVSLRDPKLHTRDQIKEYLTWEERPSER